MGTVKPKHVALLSLPVIIAVLQTLQFVSMGVWVRMMDDSFTSFQQVYIRVILSAVLAWIIFFPKIDKRLFRLNTRRDWLTYLVRATMAYGVGVLFFTFAVQNTKLALVSFIASLPFLGLMAWLMFREKIAKGTWPYILLSAVGLAFLVQVSLTDFRIDWGFTAAIIAMIGFNVGFLLARVHPKRASNYENTAIVLSLAWFVPFFAILLTGGRLVPESVSLIAWAGLLASIATNILGMVMINYVFTNMKAYVAGNIFLLEGVFALPLGLALYREIPTWFELVGAAIILLCAYVIVAKERQAIVMTE